MATSYTANAKLQKPATADRYWDVPVNANADQLDATAAIGGLAVTTAEVPSATLNVAVAAGSYVKADGTVGTYAGVASQAVTASVTNYLFLTDAGALTVGTAWPTTNHVRLAVVVAGTTTVTSLADARLPFGSAGKTAFVALAGATFDDSGGVVVLATGATNGVKLGSAATDKLGLWGATPVVQPSGAAQAALTDSTGGTAGVTLAAVGATNSGDVSGAINNNFASLANLVGAIRAALVNAGAMKGSA